jgi:hypothetical protein
MPDAFAKRLSSVSHGNLSLELHEPTGFLLESTGIMLNPNLYSCSAALAKTLLASSPSLSSLLFPLTIVLTYSRRGTYRGASILVFVLRLNGHDRDHIRLIYDNNLPTSRHEIEILTRSTNYALDRLTITKLYDALPTYN